MSSKIIVIGTFAYPGSGQDVFADELCKIFGFKKHGIGDIIREIALEQGVVPTRRNLQDIRKSCDLQFGRDYFPKRLSKKIQDENVNAIITGIRRKEEYEIFRIELQMYLIQVYADAQTRFERVTKRADLKDPKSYHEFLEQEQSELQLFDLPHLEQLADYKFDCSKEWSYYADKLQHLVKSIPIFASL